MLNQLHYLHDVSWQEIFDVWKANEGSDPVWQEFAKKEKGWETWEEWRSYQSSFCFYIKSDNSAHSNFRQLSETFGLLACKQSQ